MKSFNGCCGELGVCVDSLVRLLCRKECEHERHASG